MRDHSRTRRVVRLLHHLPIQLGFFDIAQARGTVYYLHERTTSMVRMQTRTLSTAKRLGAMEKFTIALKSMSILLQETNNTFQNGAETPHSNMMREEPFVNHTECYT